MTSLRTFRFQRKPTEIGLANNMPSKDVSEPENGELKRTISIDDSPVQANLVKRQRLISDDDDDTEENATVVQNGNSNGSSQDSVSQNASSTTTDKHDTLQTPDVTTNNFVVEVEAKLDILQKSFPSQNRLELQDVLRSCDWNVSKASVRLSAKLHKKEEENSVHESRISALQNVYPNIDRSIIIETLQKCNWNYNLASNSLINSHKSPKNSVNANGSKVKSCMNGRSMDKSRSSAHQHVSDSEDELEYSEKKQVYDSSSSDDDSDAEESSRSARVKSHRNDEMTDDRRRVFEFFNDAVDHHLSAVQGCSKKKVMIIKELRPFSSWHDLVSKISTSRTLSTDMLNSALSLIRTQDTVTRLMDRCERITARLASTVQKLTDASREVEKGGSAGAEDGLMELQNQPTILNPDFKLKPYQMIGLNWMVLMYKQQVNGILADEMGLGKTIQTIAFLAYLKESGEEGPHLIIVPSSTLENWRKELTVWCSDLEVLFYYGSQDERRAMRMGIVQNGITFDLILTTYNMVISSPEDRVLFRKVNFHYVVFDEAHMLKNMATARYENLMRVQAPRKLLLTGTPLQNNLVELMSLLVFVMPELFATKKDQLKTMFAMLPKASPCTTTGGSSDSTTPTSDAGLNGGDETDSSVGPRSGGYEKERIAHAKRIMRPFFLRRLKSEVLKHLPTKTEEVINVKMESGQEDKYFKLVADFRETAAAKLAAKSKQETTSIVIDEDGLILEQDFSSSEVMSSSDKIIMPKSGVGVGKNKEKNGNNKKGVGGKNQSSTSVAHHADDNSSGASLLMQLRKAANHPMLLRLKYTDEKLYMLARMLKKHDSEHRAANVDMIVEDLSVMSDLYIHKTCIHYKALNSQVLSDKDILKSGKLQVLDKMLPEMHSNGDRVLIFSQFTMVLDLLEMYLKIRKHKYLRLDGATAVSERQFLIDQYNNDSSIFVFILSTRAGGLGINLTAANTVIIHDVDFNPHNDKQAEDRCHRVGQTRPVKVYRLISEGTVEEGMYAMASDKLKLEQDLDSSGLDKDGKSNFQKNAKRDLKGLLRKALDVEISDAKLGSEDDLTADFTQSILS